MITSRDNPRLKLVRRLRSVGGARLISSSDAGNSDKGRAPLLLEGRHLLETALDVRLPLDCVLVDATREQAFGDLLERASAAGCEICVVESKLLREAADTNAPQGILALAHGIVPEPPPPQELVGHRVLLLDGLQDPGNVGALVRSAAAAGCSAVFAAAGTCAWWHPRALRASSGAALRIPLFWHSSHSAARLHCPRPWMGLDAHAGQSLWEADLPAGGTMVVGSETHGLSRQAAQHIELALNIPLQRGVESLNATVAASLALFAWQRRDF